MKMIKTIFFDWGGVLIDNPAGEIVQYCSEQLGVSTELFISVHNKYLDLFQIGKISEDLFWEKICSELNVDLPNTKSLWGEAFQLVYSPKVDMFDLVTNLKNQGLTTSILSNTEMPAYEFFIRQKYEMFDVLIFSCIENVRKPSELLFKIALERTSSKSTESIFIDDRMENIKSAKSIGMHTIFYKSTIDTIDQIKKYSLVSNKSKI